MVLLLILQGFVVIVVVVIVVFIIVATRIQGFPQRDLDGAGRARYSQKLRCDFEG
jgi:hypothetical protein